MCSALSRQVDQVAVVGAPDPVLGEIGVAFVVPVGTPAAAPPDEGVLLGPVRDAVAAVLADYKAPDRVVVVDGLPLTSMMKVDKRALGEQAALLPPLRPGGVEPPTRHTGETTAETANEMNGARAS